MALCLANSLVMRRDFIPYDQLVRYKWWFRHGYMSSTGKCFDIGAATKRSLIEFEHRQEQFGSDHNISLADIDFLSDPQLLSRFNVDCSEKDAAGNGALMRLAPVPLFFCRYPQHAVEFSGVSGRITHGNQIAYDACRYYGALIVAALYGESKNDLLDENFYSKHQEWFNYKPLHEKVMKIVNGSYKQHDGHKAGIRGKGYIIQALEAALWAFWSDKESFKDGVLAAVNLGDDTDTTAAIYGQLAGAYYGYEQLDQKWLESMYAPKFIQCLSKWIVYEGGRWDPNRSQALVVSNRKPNSQSNTTNALSTTQKPNSNTQQPASQSKLQKSSEKSSEKRSESGAEQNRHSNPSSASARFNNNGAVPKTQQTPGYNADYNSNEHSASKFSNPTQSHDDTSSSQRKHFNFE